MQLRNISRTDSKYFSVVFINTECDYITSKQISLDSYLEWKAVLNGFKFMRVYYQNNHGPFISYHYDHDDCPQVEGESPTKDLDGTLLVMLYKDSILNPVINVLHL